MSVTFWVGQRVRLRVGGDTGKVRAISGPYLVVARESDGTLLTRLAAEWEAT